MPAHYKNVTQTELEEYLLPQGFKRITVAGTSELVYGKRIDRDGLMLTLRVYSGIAPSGQSRSVGEDAMRVTLFMRIDENKIVMLGGSKRVHRVEGWKKNLQSRIDGWEDVGVAIRQRWISTTAIRQRSCTMLAGCHFAV